MFRYITSLILANGKSKRFNKPKNIIKIKNTNFLHFNFIKILKIGFSYPIVNGIYTNYKSIDDIIKNLGPISFLTNFKNKIFKNSCIILITIDMINIKNKTIIKIIKISNKHYSTNYTKNIFPIKIKNSNNNKNLTINYVNLKNKNMKLIINKFLKNEIKESFFSKNIFINININFNLTIY